MATTSPEKSKPKPRSLKENIGKAMLFVKRSAGLRAEALIITKIRSFSTSRSPASFRLTGNETFLISSGVFLFL